MKTAPVTPTAPVLGMKWKHHAVMINRYTGSRTVIPRSATGNYPTDEWLEVAPGTKVKIGGRWY